MRTEDAPSPLNQGLECTFGPFVPRLKLLGPSRLRIDIPSPGGTETQVVETAVSIIRPNLSMLSWVERDGTTVVHLHDYETATVHSHARLPDGTLLRSVGTIRIAGDEPDTAT
jgi:hypothetical protein